MSKKNGTRSAGLLRSPIFQNRSSFVQNPALALAEPRLSNENQQAEGS